jgi:hypothetical protein
VESVESCSIVQNLSSDKRKELEDV